MQHAWGLRQTACAVTVAVHAVSTGFVRCTPPAHSLPMGIWARGEGAPAPFVPGTAQEDWVPARTTPAGPVLIRGGQEDLRQSPILVTGLRGEYSPTPSLSPAFPLTCRARPGKVLGAAWRCPGLSTTGATASCGFANAFMTRPGQALRIAARTRPPARSPSQPVCCLLGRPPHRPCCLLSPPAPCLPRPVQVEGDPAASRASGERASALILLVPSRKA